MNFVRTRSGACDHFRHVLYFYRYHGAQEGDGEATITAREQQTQTAYSVIKFAEALSDH